MSSVIDKLLASNFEFEFRPTELQFSLIDSFIRECAGTDLCEVLYDHAGEGYNADKLASFISMLLWQTSDNGSSVCKTLETWIGSKSLLKQAVLKSSQLEVVIGESKS